MAGVLDALGARHGGVEGYLRAGGATTKSCGRRRAACVTERRPRDLRPDRVGQERRRRGARAADPGRARLRRRDAGLPRACRSSRTARRPTSSSGSAARATRPRSGEYRGSRTPRSTRSSRPDARPSSSAARACTCARRSPSWSCRRRPSPACASVWSALYDAGGASGAHALLAGSTRPRPRAVHPNDRRRVVRALELAEAGTSLAPGDGPAVGGEPRHPTLVFGLDVPREVLAGRIERADPERCSSAGVEDEVRARARRRRLGDGAQDARPRRGGGAPARGGDRGDRRSARAGTPRTSASGCGASRASLASTPTVRAGEVADEILELARARERLPARGAG